MHILDFESLTAAGRPFNLIELSKAINQSPFHVGFLMKSGIFTPVRISTTSFALEYVDSALHLIESTSRGNVNSLPSVTTNDQRKIVTFSTAHLEIVKTLLAESVQNVREFAVEDPVQSQLMAVVSRRDQLLSQMRASIEATIEYMMASAIKGIVKDGKNNVLANLFTTFNITQTTVTINMTKPISSEMVKVFDAMRKAVGSSAMVGSILAICGKVSFEKLLEKAIDETSGRAQDDLINIGNASVNGFVRGGVKFVMYPNSSDSTHTYIDDNDVHYIPLDNDAPIPNLFQIYYAPADYVETANTLGLPFYSKADLLSFGKGFALNAQSNPFPICTRPKTLIKSTIP
jgi:hypothetical protein